MRAVSQILQRSERQEDLAKLVHTLVDVGVLPQLENRNNEILYGRRGTGKTHVFKVLGSTLRESSRHVVIYIDSRTLGSTAQFSDSSLPLSKRCLALFRDVLGEVHDALLEARAANDTRILPPSTHQASSKTTSTDDQVRSRRFGGR